MRDVLIIRAARQPACGWSGRTSGSKAASRSRGPRWAKCSAVSTNSGSSTRSIWPSRTNRAIPKINTWSTTSPKDTATTWAVGFGAEVARIGGARISLDQPGGRHGFSPRGSFEISRLNLWGLGHSLNFKSRYSTLTAALLSPISRRATATWTAATSPSLRSTTTRATSARSPRNATRSRCNSRSASPKPPPLSGAIHGATWRWTRGL